VRAHGSGKTVAYDRRTFGTSTPELLALSDWLTAHGCTHVAMESSGVYWKPVWHVLDGHFELVLANAMHIRNIPGRKSDVNDATWIADLTGPRADPEQLRAPRVDYRDLGADHFDRRDKAKLAKRLIARLHDLGLVVDVRAA
jgi:transposase